MSVQTAIRDYLSRRIARWERRRTERFIRNLPLEIRKDIGWPDGATRRAEDALWERRW
ncbi:hypothetical protein [Chelativorans intermedius]|uniref:DUF1127 domain-containing protein n=1 Tax=Chelativorans intermedius TaxID=515947 RepID=A0ABV6D3V2_9HYPH|nr:hypothetical protein [Chelativorans intermedius]MCT8997018.1 hypothetical protein [Chelativorans intermedius]